MANKILLNPYILSVSLSQDILSNNVLIPGINFNSDSFFWTYKKSKVSKLVNKINMYKCSERQEYKQLFCLLANQETYIIKMKFNNKIRKQHFDILEC